jgi:hypothetical protein
MSRLVNTSLALTSIFLGSALAYALVTVGTITKISVNSSGGLSQGVAFIPRQPANGGYVAYDTNATDVIAGDSNFSRDVILKDLTSGAVSAIGVDDQGVLGNAGSQDPAISAVASDGSFAVAFVSSSTNLVTGLTDGNDVADIFVRLPKTGKTYLASFSKDIDSGGLAEANDRSAQPAVALVEAKKQLVVAYPSDATNLRTADTNGVADIYLSIFDLSKISSATDPRNAVTFESITSGVGGAEPNGRSLAPSISGDGRYIAFQSLATNLVPGIVSSAQQIYLYDRQTASISLISKGADGVEGDDGSIFPSISFSGRYVSYITNASNIVGGNPSHLQIVVRYDIATGTSERVDQLSTGEVANGAAFDSSISPDGRFVTFASFATNLASDDTSSITDVYFKDMTTGSITRIGRGFDGSEANGECTSGSFAPQGFSGTSGVMSFLSSASNLVAEGIADSSRDVYTVPITISSPAVTSDTTIEVPPDVVVSGRPNSRTITVSVQQFSAPEEALVAMLENEGDSPRAEGARRKTVVYDVRIKRRGDRDEQKKLSKRNQVAFKKQKAGSYTARYRAIVMRGKRVISRTPFSPRRSFRA